MSWFIPSSLSTRVAAMAVLIVVVIGGASFSVIQRFYRQQMIDSLAASTTVQGELIEQSLRYAMHTRSLDLLGEMVRSLASQQGVDKVMILNKQGEIRFSSNAREEGRILDESDPTCQVCHQTAPSDRAQTVVFRRSREEQVFRNVNPILNSASCVECHAASNRVNGVLIVDYSMESIDAMLGASARNMWLAAIALAVAITAALFVFMRRAVLRRIAGLGRAIDAFEAGELTKVVEEDGHDEISHLGRHLNRMARSLDRSLREVQAREAYLDAVINSAEDGIVVVDEDLRVVTANRSYHAMQRSPGVDLANMSCGMAPTCVDRAAGECPARLTFRSGRSERRIRTVSDPDGSQRYFEIEASPLVDAGDQRQVLEIWRDITRRRELEAKLAHSEKLASLGLLASGLSHEINNPLASITACLDGLERRRAQNDGHHVPEELPEYLSLIRGEVERCRKLSERLGVLVRKSTSVQEPVDLSAVIHDTLALMRYDAERSGVEIVETVPADLPRIRADESEIRQVLLNVVLNAFQAIETTGRVAVTAERENGDVKVEIVDTGRGISSEAIEQIFEPFYSTRPDGRGTGLGLFISKIMVERSGGSISVRSVPGRSTCFTLRFVGETDSSAEGLA